MRARSGLGTAALASFAAVIATLLLFAPQFAALQRAAAGFVVEVRDEKEHLATKDRIDVVLSRFARDVTMPPLCENPIEATHTDECSLFGVPHEAPAPWMQQGVENRLIAGLTSFQRDTARWGFEPQQPLCFVSHLANPGAELGTAAQWGLNCITWDPPQRPSGVVAAAPGVRPQGASKDPEGRLVFRSFEPRTNFNPLAPRFDGATGEDTEVVVSGVSYLRMFWFDTCGLVANEPNPADPCDRPDFTNRSTTYQAWRRHMACDSCPTPPTDVTAKSTGVTPTAAREFTQQSGVRRVVLLMCPNDSPDFDGNGAGDCLDALRTADTPAGETGTLGDENRVGWSYVWRYELLF